MQASWFLSFYKVQDFVTLTYWVYFSSVKDNANC